MKVELICYVATFVAGALCGYWPLRKYIDSSARRIEMLHVKLDALVRDVGREL